MSAERSELINKLKAMQSEYREILQLKKQRKDLEKYMTGCSVSESDYDTSHAKRMTEARDLEIKAACSKLRTSHPFAWVFFLVGIILCAVVIYLVSFLMGLIPLVAGLVVYFVLDSSFKKKYDAERNRISYETTIAYQQRIQDAENEDKQAKAAYRNAVKAENEQRAAQTQPKLEENARQIQLHEDLYEQNRVVSDADLAEDPKLIDKMLRLLESGRADNIKECFRWFEEEKERERRAAEERRQAEEARRRAEEERKRNSPGEVYVYVGEKHSYGYKAPRNEIIIDGQEYGPATMPYKKITLMPGLHTIRVVVQLYYGGNYHLPQSDILQFQLEGGTKKYFQFYLKDSPVVHAKECHTEASFNTDP